MNTEPICGTEWLYQHRHDHTEQEIAQLSIVVSCNGKSLPAISQDKKDRDKVKYIMKSHNSKEGRRNI